LKIKAPYGLLSVVRRRLRLRKSDILKIILKI